MSFALVPNNIQMKKTTLLIPLFFLLMGFALSYFVFNDSRTKTYKDSDSSTLATKSNTTRDPFAVRTANNNSVIRIENLEIELSHIKQQLEYIELALLNSTATSDSKSTASMPTYPGNHRKTSIRIQPIYNLDSLIRGGLDPNFAEDIVRRMSGIELQRMELQDLAIRGDYLNTEKYYEELDAINSQSINLRNELGDDQYDEYLFKSKKNNRIQISTIMLGSVAEQVGIQKNDIVLSYDNTRMFHSVELKEATSQGQLGEYVAISIIRNGEIFSYSVPRGPLGMQLRATRIEP